ncbi:MULTISPECIES: type II toxin-antitoxin system TacA family antitoxin [Pseudomonas]|uniref:type II toxin-antitoxin system TacA family antitoxin n=1 Tax=Pseudomonas TaxID=286 RepID=UPI0018688AB7|nr:DUF1778 domain-containing protein [Pseudomonas lundensis]
MTQLAANSPEKIKPVAINMRADSKKRDLIDMAAAMSGSDRTSFILDAACKRAEEVILDQRVFVIEDADFDKFERALQLNPLKSNDRLRALLERPSRWS